MTGWLMAGHNGVWRKYKKAGAPESVPLPAALVEEMKTNGEFMPAVERYLVSSGWRRSGGGVSTGWPMFMKNNKFRNLPIALLHQLRDDRVDRAVVDPHTTPSEMKQLLDVAPLRRGSPPPSGGANTVLVRR